MAVFKKTFVQDLTQNLKTHHCEAIVFSADNDSNVINVALYDAAEPATVTGSVVVYAIRADSNTVTFTGTLTDNVASATLPQACFAAPGPLAVMLQIVNGDVKTTVLKAVFTVEASTTGALIDPGSVVPDISDLLAMLDDMAALSAAASASAQSAAGSATEAAGSATAAAGSASEAETAKDRAEAAQEAIEDMGVSADTLAPGSDATVEKSVDPETGAVTLAFGIPQGEKGVQGEKGDPGENATDEQVATAADAWLGENITNPSNPPLDTSLLLSNAAAPANLVGELKDQIDDLESNVVADIAKQLGKLNNYYKSDIVPVLSNVRRTSAGNDPLELVGTSGTQAWIDIPFADFVSDYTAGDLYYFRFTIEMSADCTAFTVKDFRRTNWDDASKLRPGPSNPVTYSFVSGRFAGTSNKISIAPTVGDGLTGVTIVLRDIWLINLTKQFGSGAEPTNTTMDGIIEGGINYLYSPKGMASKLGNFGVTNVRYGSSEGTITAQPGKKGNLSFSIVEATDYIINVSKGYGAATFQVDGNTQIAGGRVKAGDHLYCGRDLSDDEISALNNGEWVTISIANGMTGGNDTKIGYNLNLSFVDTTVVNKVKWRNQVGINLTEAFGQGNEPSCATMDLILSRFVDRRPPYKTTLFNTAQAVAAPPRRLNGVVDDDQFVATMPEGNVQISSVPYSGWSGWTEIGTYGQENKASIPIYNKVHGTIETDGMISVLPLWGCWSANASNSGSAGAHHGAHVFHGWTTDRQHRLTMTQNIYSDDEASIFNYIPGDKSNTSGGIFLPLRLGTDSLSNGLSLVPVYVDGAGYAFRAKLTGIMNLNYKDRVFPKPTSSSSAGEKGDICFDSDYIYVCVDTNSWKRVALASW